MNDNFGYSTEGLSGISISSLKDSVLFRKMTNQEAENKLESVYKEYNLPKLSNEEKSEYIASMTEGFFYTPPSWSNLISRTKKI